VKEAFRSHGNIPEPWWSPLMGGASLEKHRAVREQSSPGTSNPTSAKHSEWVVLCTAWSIKIVWCKARFSSKSGVSVYQIQWSVVYLFIHFLFQVTASWALCIQGKFSHWATSPVLWLNCLNSFIILMIGYNIRLLNTKYKDKIQENIKSIYSELYHFLCGETSKGSASSVYKYII
jgi:hypothetical protein